MKEYKYSNLERDIQEVKESDRCDKWWLYSQMIADICRDDDVATDLSRRVLKKDIEDMLEKIQCIFQRSDCDCKPTEGRTDIDVLIHWLRYIEED